MSDVCVKTEQRLAAVAVNIAKLRLKRLSSDFADCPENPNAKREVSGRDAHDDFPLYAVINGHNLSLLTLLVGRQRRWRGQGESGRMILRHAAVTGRASCTCRILELPRRRGSRQGLTR